jgi:hypothetical protein
MGNIKSAMTIRLTLILLLFTVACGQRNGNKEISGSKDGMTLDSADYFISLAYKQSDTLLGDVNQFISDVKGMPNIERPKQSLIINSKYSLKDLRGVWGGAPDEPVADFELDSSYFLVADYDGNGDMPYILHTDSIYVFYNDFIRKGKIIYSTKDSLVISWRTFDSSDNHKYRRWE